MVTSGQIAWDGLQQRAVEPFKSLGTRCLVFGNGDDDVEVRKSVKRALRKVVIIDHRNVHTIQKWSIHG